VEFPLPVDGPLTQFPKPSTRWRPQPPPGDEEAAVRP
jgi:hypothetical protein